MVVVGEPAAVIVGLFGPLIRTQVPDSPDAGVLPAIVNDDALQRTWSGPALAGVVAA